MNNNVLKNILSPLLLAALLCNPALAQQDAASAQVQDGVKVGEMSRLRSLVSAEQLEAQAAQQYLGLKQQAQQQKRAGRTKRPAPAPGAGHCAQADSTRTALEPARPAVEMGSGAAALEPSQCILHAGWQNCVLYRDYRYPEDDR